MTALRRTLLTLTIALAAVATLGTGQAFAATKCAKQIIDDWYKDGRVDKIYPLHCYDEAIDALPNDVRTYSSAKEDIERALQEALRDNAPTDDPPITTGGTDETPTDTNPDDRPGPGPNDPTDTGPDPGDSNTDTVPGDAEALGETSDASSVPLPLIVLAGLALLLLAAGGAGYLNRRLQARRAGGPPEPPADL